MIFNTLNNENGSTSLLIAFGIVSVSAFMILQMSTAFSVVNSGQEVLIEKHKLSGTMQALGLLIKRSYSLGLSDPNCAMTENSETFIKRTIDGHVFCVPQSTGFCIQDKMITGTDEIVCISSQAGAMDWTGGTTPSTVTDAGDWTGENNNDSYSQSFSGQSQGQGPSRKVRFQIPNRSDKQVWRTCTDTGVACARMALCIGNTNCNMQNASALQVVRLGDLSVSP